MRHKEGSWPPQETVHQSVLLIQEVPKQIKQIEGQVTLPGAVQNTGVTCIQFQFLSSDDT